MSATSTDLENGFKSNINALPKSEIIIQASTNLAPEVVYNLEKLNPYLDALLETTLENSERKLKLPSWPSIRWKKKGESGVPIKHYDWGLLALIISIIVGGGATQSLVVASEKGAPLLPWGKIGPVDLSFLKNPTLTVTASIYINALVNIYYFYLIIASGPDYPKSEKSLDKLHNTDYSWAKSLKDLLDKTIVFLFSASGSLIFSLVDMQTSPYKKMTKYLLAGGVLWCYSMLHLNGGKAIRYEDIPWLWEKSQGAALYRKIFYHDLQKQLFQLSRQAEKYKKAYIQKLEMAIITIIGHMQQGNKVALQPIYDLLFSENKDKQSTLQLLLAIFKIVPPQQSSPDEVSQTCTQQIKEYLKDTLMKLPKRTMIVVVSLLMGTALHGYFLDGDNENTTLFNLEAASEQWLHWMLATFTFMPFAKFCVDGVIYTGTGVYDLLTSTGQKIFNYFKPSTNENKINYFPMPLTFYRHPFLMVPTVITGVAAVNSASTSLYLNQTQFERYYADKANQVYNGTYWEDIAGTILFNTSSAGPVFAGGAKAYDIVLGPEENRREIKLLEFMENQRQVALKTAPINCLEFLLGFAQLEVLNASNTENEDPVEINKEKTNPIFNALDEIIFAGQKPSTILEEKNSPYENYAAAAVRELLSQYRTTKTDFETYLKQLWEAHQKIVHDYRKNMKELHELGFFSLDKTRRLNLGTAPTPNNVEETEIKDATLEPTLASLGGAGFMRY